MAGVRSLSRIVDLNDHGAGASSRRGVGAADLRAESVEGGMPQGMATFASRNP